MTPASRAAVKTFAVPADVHGERVGRILHRTWNRADRGEVKDQIRPFAGAADRRQVPDVALDELDRRRGSRQVLAPPRREIVEDANRTPGGDERVDEVRSDEAGAARHEGEPAVSLRPVRLSEIFRHLRLDHVRTGAPIDAPGVDHDRGMPRHELVVHRGMVGHDHDGVAGRQRLGRQRYGASTAGGRATSACGVPRR